MATAVSPLQPSDLKSMMSGKRKMRIPKACYQCYKRKVKCDRTSPCALCVKRGHAHLCTYTHPSKKPSPLPSPGLDSKRTTSSGRKTTTAGRLTMDKKPERVLVDPKEWKIINKKLAEMSESISTLRSKLEEVSTTCSPASDSGGETEPRSNNPETEGIHMRNVLGGSPVHFGSSSVLAFILERSRRSSTAGSVFREDGILPQLALENQAATYPFLDLWSSDLMTVGSGAVCAALPDDNLCRRLSFLFSLPKMKLTVLVVDFQALPILSRRPYNAVSRPNGYRPVRKGYGEIAAQSVPKQPQHESRFGSGRAVRDEYRVHRDSLRRSGLWLSTVRPAQKREDSAMPGLRYEIVSVSSTFDANACTVSCSYQCLRNANFLSRPTVEAIQTLLILGDTLSYNMNPGVAYVTFGRTAICTQIERLF